MVKLSAEAEENRPKRPLTSFFKYRLRVIDDVKDKFPDLDGKAVMKIISNMWAEISD
jgi:hypothetical protein